MPLKVCVVTGGRADYGLLVQPMRALHADPAFNLQVVATGQHLSAWSGGSLDVITRDGFTVAAQIDMQLEDDSPAAVTRSMGRAVAGFADVFETLRPDLLMVLGDRYEILAAAQAALLFGIPVAHLCGGDITLGAFDDSIRHALTKLSHLHFPTTEEAARRIRQMGEAPDRVHAVGSPGIDLVLATPTLDRATFFGNLGLPDDRKSFLVTFHPPTLAEDGAAQCQELLAALEALGPEVVLIFTGVNVDPGGRTLQHMIAEFAAAHPAAVCAQSLGAQRYFSALSHVDAVIGNSSSGLYEAPSFKVPTVNIGDRQSGRLKAASVIDCPPQRAAIAAAIDQALALDCSHVVNPYGDGHASERIADVLRNLREPRSLVHKVFHTPAEAS